MVPLVFMGFTFVLLLSHHFGRADHPTQVRLFLPISFSLSVLAVYLLRDIERYVDVRYLMIIFVVLCFHHRHYAIHDPLTAQLTMTREVRHIREFLDKEARPGDLYVYDRPGQLSAMGLSSVSWDRFKKERKGYLGNVRSSLFNRLVLIDRPKYKPADPADASLEQPGYRLEVQREHQLTPEERLRISVAVLTPGEPAEEAKEPVPPAKAEPGKSAKPPQRPTLPRE